MLRQLLRFEHHPHDIDASKRLDPVAAQEPDIHIVDGAFCGGAMQSNLIEDIDLFHKTPYAVYVLHGLNEITEMRSYSEAVALADAS